MKEVMKIIYKKIRIPVIITFVFVGLNIYFLTFPSKILGNIIDLLSNIELNKKIIMHNIFLLISISVLIFIIRIPWKVLISYITRNIEKILQDKLFEHFIQIELDSIQNIKNGELMSYFVKDIAELRGFSYRLLSHASRVFLVSIIATYTMIKVNVKLTIVSLCPIVITIFITLILKERVERKFKKSQKYFTYLSEYVQESTDAIRTTKAYSGEFSQFKKFVKKNKILKKSNISVEFYSTLLTISVELCFGICYGITILFGSKLVLENQITIGQFVAFNGYIELFFSPISWIPGLISKLKRAQISYRRLDKVFKLEKEKLLPEKIVSQDNLKGNISINNLTFNYPEYMDKVLDGITININEGETLGIIGTIGSGKTTLMNLLLRLYKVPNEKIFIDGKDINEIDLSKLRENICYITQDNFLFSTTIKENVSLFNNKLSDEDVEKSTDSSMLREDINQMEKGIYTIIGERGIDLSGGQKQRVALSRAFINKSNIVIFDDTFSALDNKTEKKLLENIRDIFCKKTCIIISNRISDVKNADKIIVLDSGKIIECGKHEQLLKNNGLYKKFYDQQTSNNIDLFN